ncbi:hypothetical protein CEUSTIGMA_g5717.t1 [Chlamydomonas eustigma]|uniref:Uncharacterized protein n=1 Tax=Chlamydomonas eustigma TaxID=1157962 RepID=A0A250X5C0_9CHLO|nr:hypothetical protein CEUSTIGMA_g5717.t1 [Chlamydomonas eustigma]|eukprot:GAX78275.1 hypothetical protein CEUSTIGMA_g5717.t1 [Chlamydomonas eustigma]
MHPLFQSWLNTQLQIGAKRVREAWQSAENDAEIDGAVAQNYRLHTGSDPGSAGKPLDAVETPGSVRYDGYKQSFESSLLTPAFQETITTSRNAHNEQIGPNEAIFSGKHNSSQPPADSQCNLPTSHLGHCPPHALSSSTAQCQPPGPFGMSQTEFQHCNVPSAWSPLQDMDWSHFLTEKQRQRLDSWVKASASHRAQTLLEKSLGSSNTASGHGDSADADGVFKGDDSVGFSQQFKLVTCVDLADACRRHSYWNQTRRSPAATPNLNVPIPLFRRDLHTATECRILTNTHQPHRPQQLTNTPLPQDHQPHRPQQLTNKPLPQDHQPHRPQQLTNKPLPQDRQPHRPQQLTNKPLPQDDSVASFNAWLMEKENQVLMDPGDSSLSHFYDSSPDPLISHLQGRTPHDAKGCNRKGDPLFTTNPPPGAYARPCPTATSAPTSSTDSLLTGPQILLHEDTLKYLALLAYKLANYDFMPAVTDYAAGHNALSQDSGTPTLSNLISHMSGKRNNAVTAIPFWHLPFKVVHVPPPLQLSGGGGLEDVTVSHASETSPATTSPPTASSMILVGSVIMSIGSSSSSNNGGPVASSRDQLHQHNVSWQRRQLWREQCSHRLKDQLLSHMKSRFIDKISFEGSKSAGPNTTASCKEVENIIKDMTVLAGNNGCQAACEWWNMGGHVIGLMRGAPDAVPDSEVMDDGAAGGGTGEAAGPYSLYEEAGSGSEFQPLLPASSSVLVVPVRCTAASSQQQKDMSSGSRAHVRSLAGPPDLAALWIASMFPRQQQQQHPSPANNSSTSPPILNAPTPSPSIHQVMVDVKSSKVMGVMSLDALTAWRLAAEQGLKFNQACDTVAAVLHLMALLPCGDYILEAVQGSSCTESRQNTAVSSAAPGSTNIQKHHPGLPRAGLSKGPTNISAGISMNAVAPDTDFHTAGISMNAVAPDTDFHTAGISMNAVAPDTDFHTADMSNRCPIAGSHHDQQPRVAGLLAGSTPHSNFPKLLVWSGGARTALHNYAMNASRSLSENFTGGGVGCKNAADMKPSTSSKAGLSEDAINIFDLKSFLQL